MSTLINEAVARTGSVGADGKAVHFAPHDFRRMFITDAVMNGLPPHIAQVIAGHHDLNVTMGYKAVYPEEALQAHLAFLARRRRFAPATSTAPQLTKSGKPFSAISRGARFRSGLAGGRSGPPASTSTPACAAPCCGPTRPARPARRHPRQHRRPDLRSHARGWFGEVEGLKVSLAGAEDKLDQLERRAARPIEESLAASR